MTKREKLKKVRYGRSYKYFNQNEFENELKIVDWNILFQNKTADECTTIFCKKIDHLLDEMAPIRHLTKKEVNLMKIPWITKGILISMMELHKEYINENYSVKKFQLFKLYKQERNMIISLIRKIKSVYYVAFF